MITKRQIEALEPDPSRDVFLRDPTLRGYAIRMKPSGFASYVIEYRNAQGRNRRLVLGPVVGALTPQEAHKLARERLRDVAKGEDPAEDKRATRAALTVAEVCDWYLAEAEAGRILGKRRRPIKASTLLMDRSRIEAHVKPLLGRRAVGDLTRQDVEQFQISIASGKTSKGKPKGRGGQTRGGRGVASRTVGMLGTIFRHAGIDPNPCRDVRRYADERRTRFLSLEEISKLGEAMREAEAEGRTATGLAAIRALILTGCRKAEILTLKREHVDAPASCIRFADTKSGAQVRPIGKAAVEALCAHPLVSEWVFPADLGPGHFVGVTRVLGAVCKRAGLDGVSPHVLRHTFASVATDLGYSELIIAGLLGHAARGVTQRYSHLPDASLVAAADKVSARIAAALDGGKVLSMRQRSA